MTKLELLYAQKSKKFDQLCALVARELGYDELSILTAEDRIRVEDQATQHVELWEETVEMNQLHHSANYAFASPPRRVSRHLRKNPRRA
jgi:hypothetical protein